MSVGWAKDAEEILEERRELRDHLVQAPDDLEAMERLASILGLDPLAIPSEDGSLVGDGTAEELRGLLRRIRQADPDHRDAWCQDLDTLTTLDEALQIVAREPGHWLVNQCLAEFLMNDAQEERAIRLLDAFLAASGFVDSLSDPFYEFSTQERTAVTLLATMAETSDLAWEKLAEFAGPTGHVELRYSLAVQVIYAFDEDDVRRRWAAETLVDLLETELPPSMLESICEWLWFDREDEVAARQCFETVLARGTPREDDEDWHFAVYQARDSLNRIDLEDGLLESVALRIEQGPATGRMHLWESFLRGVPEEETGRACEALADAWLRGAFEDEVLAKPESCPRRLDILLELMTDCGFEALLRQRIGEADTGDDPATDPKSATRGPLVGA